MRIKISLLPVLLGLTAFASADVHVLSASLDGAQEVPPVATPATGVAQIVFDDVTGIAHIRGSYSGLSANASAAHLHGLAGAGMNAGIIIGLTPTGGLAGEFEGSGFLSASQAAGLLAGQTYINVHNSMHPGGEIRGQVLHDLQSYAGTMDGAQANINTVGTGTFVVDIDPNTGFVDIQGTYTGMTGNVTNAHLHGPAWFGQGAGTLINLTHSGGMSGTLSGSGFLSASNLNEVLDGFSYINVHSTFAGPGEIRGQVLPQFLGANYCIPEANSTGLGTQLRASGSPRVVDNDVTLMATNMPPNQFGYAVASRGAGQVFPVGGSQGRLCIAGPNQSRFQSTIQSSGAGGTFSAALDLGSFPANPTVAVVPGDTWNFQLWHRDLNPSTTSNFSNGVTIKFR